MGYPVDRKTGPGSPGRKGPERDTGPEVAELKHGAKKRVGLLILGAAALCFCAWAFGWGGGPIDVMDFSAEDVDRIELSETLVDSGPASPVTEPADIQALIDSVNAFRRTGNSIRYLFRDGIGAGGSVLYTFHVYLKSGEEYILNFASNRAQEPADTEVSYWVYPAEGLFEDTCRGSLEVYWAR